jgi:hypothetical protein
VNSGVRHFGVDPHALLTFPPFYYFLGFPGPEPRKRWPLFASGIFTTQEEREFTPVFKNEHNVEEVAYLFDNPFAHRFRKPLPARL